MTGAYTFSIPSTAALADLSAATFCGAPAPAIAAGSNRDVVDMTNAIEETRARKRCKQTHDTSVTAGELAASIIRQTAVASEFVADTYNNNHGDGLAGAPAWAAPLIANVATLTANQATMSANQATIMANVATLMANQATMDARLRAERAQRRNQRNHRTGGNHPLTQLVKCAANVGPPLPGRVAQNPAAAAGWHSLSYWWACCHGAHYSQRFE